jgi:Putative DNA-binding domain
MTSNLDLLTGEESSLDFKAYFDPQSKGDWCELIKGLIAMTNSGGGIIVVGVNDDGTAALNSDVAPLLAVDSADVTNKIHSYTHQHFADFDIVSDVRHGQPVAVIDVKGSDIPIVFTAHGGYEAPGGKGQKAAFVKGSVYFRHGAKSEPGTTDDLREAIERRLEQVKEFWLNGIGKVMTAPAGAEVQIVQRAVTVTSSGEAMPVRLASDGSAPAVGINNATLQDAPDATAIRLTNDENAPVFSVMQTDKLYPHRQTELLKRLAERLDGNFKISSHDLQCVRRVYIVDENPMFSYQSQHSPRKYTDGFVDWILKMCAENPKFFQNIRDSIRQSQEGSDIKRLPILTDKK